MLVILKNYNRVINLDSFDGIKMCADPFYTDEITVAAYRNLGCFYLNLSGSLRGRLEFTNGFERLCKFPSSEKETAQAMFDKILAAWLAGDKNFTILN